MLKAVTLAAFGVVLCIAACNEGACISGVGAQGITLSARDSVSGAVLDSSVIVTVVRLEPKFAPVRPDSARGGITEQESSNPLSLAEDMPGRYRVTIEAPGYRTWNRDVNVEMGCGSVRTVEIIARLQPVST